MGSSSKSPTCSSAMASTSRRKAQTRISDVRCHPRRRSRGADPGDVTKGLGHVDQAASLRRAAFSLAARTIADDLGDCRVDRSQVDDSPRSPAGRAWQPCQQQLSQGPSAGGVVFETTGTEPPPHHPFSRGPGSVRPYAQPYRSSTGLNRPVVACLYEGNTASSTDAIEKQIGHGYRHGRVGAGRVRNRSARVGGSAPYHGRRF